MAQAPEWRPLRAWSDARLRPLCDALIAACDAWQRRWRVAPGAALPPVVPVARPAAAPEPPSAAGAAPTIGWGFEIDGRAADPRSALARQLFGTAAPHEDTPPASSGLAMAVADAAWRDWLAQLQRLWPAFTLVAAAAAGSGHGAAAALPKGAARWSGAVRVQWAAFDGTWWLHLPVAAIEAALHPAAAAARPAPSHRPPRQRLAPVLAGEPVVLHVELDGAWVDLGQLQSLQPGDVLVLQHPLDAAARLQTDDGHAIGAGWLGRREARLALELAPAHAAPGPTQRDAPDTPPSASSSPSPSSSSSYFHESTA